LVGWLCNIYCNSRQVVWRAQALSLLPRFEGALSFGNNHWFGGKFRDDALGDG